MTNYKILLAFLINILLEIFYSNVFSQNMLKPAYTIEEGLTRANEVTHLDLFNNSLKELPKTILEFRRLEELFAPFNQFTTIPKEINLLRNLKMIDLSHNKIEKLPYMGNLIRLEHLSLGNNYLLNVPEGLFELNNLKVLSLYNNKKLNLVLSFKQISKLLNLEELHLSGIEFSILPESIAQLKNLKKLSIDNTKLT